MITAFVFPGQGSFPQPRDLRAAQATPRGRALLEVAAREAALSDPSGFCAGGGHALARASVLCPLIVALGLSEPIWADDSKPRGDVVFVGHSLGEHSALAAAGALEACEAIALAAERGRALDEAARACPSGLYALDRPHVARALELGEGQASVALDNADDEVVLGAPEPVLRRIAALVPGHRVRVPGAFHTELMLPARMAFATALRCTRLAAPRKPVLSPVTLRFLESPADVGDALLEGITKPVRFREAMGIVSTLGEVDARVLPPVGALRALVRKNLDGRAKWVAA